MRKLSSYFLRTALIALLAGGLATIAAGLAMEWISFRNFVTGLDEPLRDEFLNKDTLSPELAAALQDFYNSPIQNVVWPFAILLGMVVAGAVGIWHSRRLMRPIDTVAAAMGRLAAGKRPVRADTKPCGIVEIDSFIRDFNTMSHAVDRSERELQAANAAIAHELRTPLTVMIGRINGMIDGVFPTDRPDLETLLNQTAQLHRIIDDLRLLTLARAGQITVETEALDLARIAANVPLPDEMEDVEYDLATAPARADPARVRQMLGILLDNAARYGASGVRVATWADEDGVVLSVADRGPGLDTEDARQAFDTFWRGEGSRARQTGGSGLGLAVLRHLAEAHGGFASYVDRPGGGADFRVTLPHDPGPRPDLT